MGKNKKKYFYFLEKKRKKKRKRKKEKELQGILEKIHDSLPSAFLKSRVSLEDNTEGPSLPLKKLPITFDRLKKQPGGTFVHTHTHALEK